MGSVFLGHPVSRIVFNDAVTLHPVYSYFCFNDCSLELFMKNVKQKYSVYASKNEQKHDQSKN